MSYGDTEVQRDWGYDVCITTVYTVFRATILYNSFKRCLLYWLHENTTQGLCSVSIVKRRKEAYSLLWWSTNIPIIQLDPRSPVYGLYTVNIEPSTHAFGMHKWTLCLSPVFTLHYSGNLYSYLYFLHFPLLWTLCEMTSRYSSHFCLDFIPTWLSFT